jgi:hypothetical protein
MWFNEESCKHGIECLRQYRSDFDDRAKTFRDQPKHDWTSHSADAMRYLAMAYNELVPSVAQPKQATKIEFQPITVNQLLRAQRTPNRKWE